MYSSFSQVANLSLSYSSQVDNDITALENVIQHPHPLLTSDPCSSASIRQFGVTANCPQLPVQLPEGAMPAVSALLSNQYLLALTWLLFVSPAIGYDHLQLPQKEQVSYFLCEQLHLPVKW